jgi:cell division protease FtsH
VAAASKRQWPPSIGRMSRQPSDPRSGRNQRSRPSGPGPGPNGMMPRSGGEQSWRWAIIVLLALVLAALVLPSLFNSTPHKSLSYTQFVQDVSAGKISSVTINNTDGHITGELTNHQAFALTGPEPFPSKELAALEAKNVHTHFVTPSSGLLDSLLIYVLPFVLFLGIIIWFNRRAQGQMSGIMSINRSKAKVYTTERPKTTFDDVAGYPGVKQEISEVVDFLKTPGRFREIGARIPRGILLVGPPGTGKTLLARAVAGEAGVPFLSVTGSDFMEMFVGVGASRVRDLFQTARKQAPAIIFIDEIDSIGRKRGAGLGGGHDEREQTLNQMLAEMDGFDATEGIVMMGATNRPDILDPALLRPGRFDRQIVVPLPDLEERLPILRVHCRDKKLAPNVDLELLARGTPGMSGADLANLVNEAALHAVRRGSQVIEMQDFEAARDRVMMGQRRESLVLSDEEKERVAFHEGGHAVLAYVLPHADPVHKVTILPTGMALGVTQQLPLEERHIYPREYIEDSLAVRMGGRVAELLVYGDLSTGASNDLVGNTELARKMVREWGMSSRVGPMAWGSQGMVFLGEDLMHSRDYSEDTSRLIDEEVAQILREQEERATQYLTEHKKGLEAVAKALLEKETISGEEVGRLVDEAYGRPVYPGGTKPGFVPSFSPDEQSRGEDDGAVVPELTGGSTSVSSSAAQPPGAEPWLTSARSSSGGDPHPGNGAGGPLTNHASLEGQGTLGGTGEAGSLGSLPPRAQGPDSIDS